MALCHSSNQFHWIPHKHPPEHAKHSRGYSKACQLPEQRVCRESHDDALIRKEEAKNCTKPACHEEGVLVPRQKHPCIHETEEYVLSPIELTIWRECSNIVMGSDLNQDMARVEDTHASYELVDTPVVPALFSFL